MDYSRYQCLAIEKDDRVATVTLNRPETGNRIEHRFHAELQDIWVDLLRDKEVNAILLTGSGRYFSVGGNIKGMQDRPGGDVFEEGEMLGPIRRRRSGRIQPGRAKSSCRTINGDCMGLAATVALLCDITVASRTARIADPHVKVGLVAGDGGAVIWPMLVGPNRAKEFLMRGNLIDALEAERIGLVNYAVAPDEVLPKARELARELANGAPWAIRWTKLAVNKAIRDQFNLIMDASYALEMCTFQTDDHREAVRAFVEKRKPQFTGR